MPAKVDTYLDLARETALGLAGSVGAWTAFLDTASRLYKYPFADQLMIHAQRPGATACASYEVWNDTMRRYVRRGAKGIALVDNSGDAPRLRYVFDIADTGTRRSSRPFSPWEINDGNLAEVQLGLRQAFNAEGEWLSSQLQDVARDLAEMYFDAHRHDIAGIIDGSLMAGYDEGELRDSFTKAAYASTAYALLSRCGYDPAAYFDEADFAFISEWNTSEAVTALGTAVSENTHMHGGKSVASALKLRTGYAMNPNKTENGKLISAFACDPHTADAEFLLSKRQYRQFTGREQTSDVIAYQVRQSFKPGEVTAEEANRIGVEFAEHFLKGKHAYIVCTHTDRRHIHNHILWNSTTLDCRGKFDNFWGSSRAVRALSDTLCIEHGLSVVEAPKRRGKSYNKWLAEQKPSLLIDIQAKLAEGKGAGYERWAKVFNLKQMAQTINFLKENGDMDFDELSRRAEAASEKCSALTEKLKATEARMSEVEELKKQVINYLRTRETFRAYKASGYSKRYLAEHEQEILLHRAAKKAFNDLGLKKLPTVKALQAEYAALLAEKRAAYPAYREARTEMKKLLTYRANAETILGGKECIANTPSKYGHR